MGSAAKYASGHSVLPYASSRLLSMSGWLRDEGSSTFEITLVMVLIPAPAPPPPPPPLINVRKPVIVAPGIDGSLPAPLSGSLVALLLRFQNRCRDEYGGLACGDLRFRDASATKNDRKAVKEMVDTAMLASACCQKCFHDISIASSRIPSTTTRVRRADTRTIAVMTINTLRQRNAPRPNFCLGFIRTFQRSRIGMATTGCV